MRSWTSSRSAASQSSGKRSIASAMGRRWRIRITPGEVVPATIVRRRLGIVLTSWLTKHSALLCRHRQNTRIFQTFERNFLSSRRRSPTSNRHRQAGGRSRALGKQARPRKIDLLLKLLAGRLTLLLQLFPLPVESLQICLRFLRVAQIECNASVRLRERKRWEILPDGFR